MYLVLEAVSGDMGWQGAVEPTMLKVTTFSKLTWPALYFSTRIL